MAKKVLVIDDDSDFVESIVNLLEARGYNVASASNGKEGVAAAKAEKPDVILLDVMMTTKDEGFNVARELQSIEGIKGTPVIMVTGVRKEMNLPFGFEPDETWLPVKQILEKPVKPETLLAAVADALK
ncbi:MAG TPA: response regulator [Anaerohalosphaeraceae bacterium]|nr:response regulator [Phycisphaerae bacterium]HOK95101.1 response regulator [Anaerohalosphaeraceae bacterium]HOL31228.1 response regulator [Anaerohalosphaeraceae bacterium]HOM76505.1 response regulator [Anaerohalosphaeraceae bacterium]HPC63839.1 response regulator [Anaerohalosphaeraceae bacterium]